VAKMQISERKRRPGEPVAFERRAKLRTSARRLFVRVIDGAGNRSSWARVRVERRDGN